jgi:hypothetical protein
LNLPYLIQDCLGIYNHYSKCDHRTYNTFILKDLTYDEEPMQQPWPIEINGIEITQEMKTTTNNRLLDEGLINNPEPENHLGRWLTEKK